MREKAEKVATEVHKGQMRKDGITPYIEHPRAVVGILERVYPDNENMICAGWLHDVIEDGEVDKVYLEQEFNPEIARDVDRLSRKPGQTQEEYQQQIIMGGFSVRMVKLADVIHNMSTIQPSFARHTIERRIKQCDDFYLKLARKTCPEFYDLLNGIVDSVRYRLD